MVRPYVTINCRKTAQQLGLFIKHTHYLQTTWLNKRINTVRFTHLLLVYKHCYKQAYFVMKHVKQVVNVKKTAKSSFKDKLKKKGYFKGYIYSFLSIKRILKNRGGDLGETGGQTPKI